MPYFSHVFNFENQNDIHFKFKWPSIVHFFLDLLLLVGFHSAEYAYVYVYVYVYVYDKAD